MCMISSLRLFVLFLCIIFNSLSITTSHVVSWLNGSSDSFDFRYQRTLLHVVGNEQFMAIPTIGIITELSQKGSDTPAIPKDPRTLWDTHVCLIPQLFSSFQLEQWNKAREEIRRYDVERVMNSYTRPSDGDLGYDPHNLKFYLHPYYLFRITSNGNHLRGSDGKKLQVNYFTIYKAASTYVRNLLAEFCKKCFGKISWSEMYLFEWMKKDRMKRTKVSLRKTDGQYSFAIVRDPMARFISGFTELEQRRRDKKANETKAVSKTVVNQPKKTENVQPQRCMRGFICTRSMSFALDAESKRRHWEEKTTNDDRLETFIFWLLRYDGSHSVVRECPECDHITPQGTIDCWMVTL